MRIDNRKVNGHVLVDATDVVSSFVIRLDPHNATAAWVAFDQSSGNFIQLDPKIVAADISKAQDNSPLSFIRFVLSTPGENDGESTMEAVPVYYQDAAGDIQINIGSYLANKKLNIAYGTGIITIV